MEETTQIEARLEALRVGERSKLAGFEVQRMNEDEFHVSRYDGVRAGLTLGEAAAYIYHGVT